MRRFLPGLTVALCASVALAFPFSDVPPGAGLALQATTPGTAQVGNVNMTGTFQHMGGADVVLTGTTTVNGTVAVTGVGTLFTTELAVGDNIAVSSASTTFATVMNIASNTSLTLLSPLGNGTSQTITKRPRAERVDNNAGTMTIAVGSGSSNIGTIGIFDSSISQMRYAGTSTHTLRRLNGTRASPTTIVNNDAMGSFAVAGFDGTTTGTGASIIGSASSDWTASSHESRMVFSTVASGSTTPTTALTIRSDKLLSLSSAYTSSLLLVDSSNIIQARAVPSTCTLNGGTPSTCTITVTTGSTVCWCSNKGASAAIAALGCAWGVSGTTLTITSAATASHDVSGGCY